MGNGEWEMGNGDSEFGGEPDSQFALSDFLLTTISTAK